MAEGRPLDGGHRSGKSEPDLCSGREEEGAADAGTDAGAGISGLGESGVRVAAGEVIDVGEEVDDDVEAEQAEQADEVGFQIGSDEQAVQEVHAGSFLRRRP